MHEENAIETLEELLKSEGGWLPKRSRQAERERLRDEQQRARSERFQLALRLEEGLPSPEKYRVGGYYASTFDGVKLVTDGSELSGRELREAAERDARAELEQVRRWALLKDPLAAAAKLLSAAGMLPAAMEPDGWASSVDFSLTDFT